MASSGKCSSGSEDSDLETEWSDVVRTMALGAGLEPSIPDGRDEGTPDSWVQRNSSLIRLTGRHPFNSEPPLSGLMRHGFITPTSLHYVRNHGHVPRATWQDWTLDVSGLVTTPKRFTMDQLVSDFPTRQFPVTLVCAGNRRKEQNMVKQTLGFNWGPSAVSTSLWRGVPLRCILKRCGIRRRRRNQDALYVCFEGEEDLHGGGRGRSKYGTSIRKEAAMDPSRDILVAYMQNGELLSPDHGFPVRMIIPGFIGGRMVKWLKRIVVTNHESRNYYHYNDNRVLPPHVDDAQLANAQAWWYKPEYIINELNINSVITKPCHGEILFSAVDKLTTTYTFRGYAYSGGGKKVTRVELTMDRGDTWHVCEIDRHEKPNRYGKYWCWCFWCVDVLVDDLLGSEDIVVRAWDETLNTQPEKMTWNLMGMMNNCWYRVKTCVCETGIRFEHPIQPGNQAGGWMEVEGHQNPDPSESVTPAASAVYSLVDMSNHKSAESTWIVIGSGVYDCTRFLKDHPGGAHSILINAGTDCTGDFEAIHSDYAKKLLQDFRIGDFETSGTTNKEFLIPPLKLSFFRFFTKMYASFIVLFLIIFCVQYTAHGA